MCNLYSVTSSQQAICQLARTIRDLTGNLPSLPAIFPDQMAPVVRTGADGGRELVMMRWGFPPPMRAESASVTNIRNTASHWWKPWLRDDATGEQMQYIEVDFDADGTELMVNY